MVFLPALPLLMPLKRVRVHSISLFSFKRVSNLLISMMLMTFFWFLILFLPLLVMHSILSFSTLIASFSTFLLFFVIFVLFVLLHYFVVIICLCCSSKNYGEKTQFVNKYSIWKFSKINFYFSDISEFKWP